MSTRNKYSKEFKEEAVKLLKTSGKTSLEISGDLGISRDNLLRWNREFETEERAGSTETINSEDFKEIKRLKKELAIVKQERDILKKAVGIFTKAQE